MKTKWILGSTSCISTLAFLSTFILWPTPCSTCAPYDSTSLRSPNNFPCHCKTRMANCGKPWHRNL